MFLPPPAKTPLNPSQLAKRRFFTGIPPTTHVHDGNEQNSAALDDFKEPKREMKMDIKNEAMFNKVMRHAGQAAYQSAG